MADIDCEIFIDSLKETIVLSEISYTLYKSLIKKYPDIIENTIVKFEAPSHLIISSKNKKYIIRILRRFFNISKVENPDKIIDFISFREFGKDMEDELQFYLLDSLYRFYEKE